MTYSSRSFRWIVSVLTLAMALALLSSCTAFSTSDGDAALRSLRARAERLSDARDIKRLQRAYGYYWDKAQWDDVADLFAADATADYADQPRLTGQRKIREYLLARGHGRNGLAYGELNNHMILQPVVHVAPDGKSAKARWRALEQTGQFKQRAQWGEGTYEIEYRKERGIWKIHHLQWFPTFAAPYKGGWARVSHTPPPSFHYVHEYVIPAGSTLLGREIARLEAHDAIENLQGAYGYYLDKWMWNEASALFTQDATYEVEQRGVYQGPARIRAALGLKGPNGLAPGVLAIEMQLQPLIHVSEDGRSAKARWRTLEMKGVQGNSGQWGEGVYENEYVIEDGAWKISKLHYYLTFRADYDKGWTEGPLPIEGPSATLPPDAPPTERYGALPEVYLPPYHYENPVTHASARPALPQHSRAVRELSTQVARLQDEIDVQNLQRSYGYYVDKHMWDEVTELFADDATLEIGGRGVFVGKSRIKQYLYFLGQKGPARGWLYDHSQWQMIVHVDDTGDTASARLRAFIMGGAPKREDSGSNDAVFGEATAFGEATYENRYVKHEGVWKIQRLYAYFNFYTPYTKGWAEVSMPNTRPEAALPPDRPPTVKYETFPTPGLVPYHYRNPVSGR